jgi:hypothetical protein
MLHAIDKGKTKFYHRYLGRRDDDERKVHEEDEITSTVLGPLDFLPAMDVYRFWREVLHSTGHAAFLPSAPPSDVDVALWPRGKAKNDGNSIEPDGVVTIKTADGQTRILLLELKWRAGLGGKNKNQLHRQWKQLLNEAERAQALHLFIAPEITAGAQAPNNEEAGGDVWQSPEGSRLVLLPWLRIRAILSEFAKENSALGRWANLSDLFLERVGIRRFAGFRKLTTPFPLLAVDLPYLFWTPHQFSGLAVCGEPPVLLSPIPAPLFFAH